MKKLLLLFFIWLFTFDTADAQMAYMPGTSPGNADGIYQADDLSGLLAKKRRKKRRKSKKKGKGGSDYQATVGAGLIYNLPMGNFAKEDDSVGAPGVKGGIGLNIDGDYFISSNLSVGVNTGYYSFKYDLTDDTLVMFDKKKYSIVPLTIKGTYYFSEGPLRPFVGLNLGMFLINSNITMQYMDFYYNSVTGLLETRWMSTEYKDVMTKFGFAPMAGFLYDVSDQLLLNFNLRYDYVSAKYEPDYSKGEIVGFQNATFLGIHFGVLYKF